MIWKDRKGASKKIPILPLRITKPNAEVTQIVNDFFDRFYKHEYILKLNAVKVPVTTTYDVVGIQSGNLVQFLLNALENYVITKGKPDENAQWACFLFGLITTAYGANVIDAGDAMKAKKCEEENLRLRDIQVKLEVEILKLKKDNEDLHKALDKFGGRSNVIEE